MPGNPFSTISGVEVFNFAIFILFTVCFAYQLVYLVVALVRKAPERVAAQNHRYAVIVCARNESRVIGDIIHSIRMQNYPPELIDIFIVADNCTDNTAEVAAAAGATVFKRFNTEKVGKGYALQYGFDAISTQCGIEAYEAYFVFDADNVLDGNYFKEMNKAFDNGALACTSYRNAKNFSSNWISAGYGIWFLREARYLNQARYTLNTSCAISGTGFFVSSELIKRNGGWDYHLLTEDIQFSVDTILKQERISYCPKAVIYDEQPLTFAASWHQRLRWARGIYQVFMNYGGRLFKGQFTNKPGYRFACYDLLMTIAPGLLLTALSLVFNLTVIALGATQIMHFALPTVATAAWSLVYACGYYATFMFLFGLLTTITEWRMIHCTPARKIGYAFTFPLFMLTYIPIAIVALFKTPQWRPTEHSITVDVEEYSTYLGS